MSAIVFTCYSCGSEDVKELQGDMVCMRCCCEQNYPAYVYDHHFYDAAETFSSSHCVSFDENSGGSDTSPTAPRIQLRHNINNGAGNNAKKLLPRDEFDTLQALVPVPANVVRRAIELFEDFIKRRQLKTTTRRAAFAAATVYYAKNDFPHAAAFSPTALMKYLALSVADFRQAKRELKREYVSVASTPFGHLFKTTEESSNKRALLPPFVHETPILSSHVVQLRKLYFNLHDKIVAKRELTEHTPQTVSAALVYVAVRYLQRSEATLKRMKLSDFSKWCDVSGPTLVKLENKILALCQKS